MKADRKGIVALNYADVELLESYEGCLSDIAGYVQGFRFR